MVFANNTYFKRLSYGELGKDELPLDNERIAAAFNTSVENVEMQQMLDAKIKEVRSFTNKELKK